jgi:transposase InsO family protein
MYEQLLQPSLRLIFRITALGSLPIHKGLAVSPALFCEKFSRKSGQSKLLVQVLNLNHKTVERLMKILGLKCQVRMKKYSSYKGEVGKIAPNLLERNFEASRPNEKWVTDVTEFGLFGQKLYLSPILDLYDRSIITYTIYEHPVLSMVTDMVKSAVKKENIKSDLILHSDQGWQYQHKQYQRLLAENGITQSMSRKGNCLDNSVMENFFGLLKTELLYIQKFTSVEHFKSELVDYIDWYNNKRTKAKFGYVSPIDYRSQAA